jgi:hypothetical protein
MASRLRPFSEGKAMKSKLIYLLIVALAIGCGGRKSGRAVQQQYETVEEGSAEGVTSTIHGPGETMPPITDTSIDTTTNFALNPNVLPPTQAPAQTQSTLPPPMMAAAPPPPLPITPPKVTPPRPAEPQPEPEPEPAVEPEPAPPTHTDTATTTTTAPEEPPEPATDTTATEEPPPPPPGNAGVLAG